MNGVWGRDPWRYGDAGMPEYQRANSRAWHWPIIQSFPYGQMPTIPELRVMIYHTIARGAKGMFFFTTGQSYISWSWLKEKGLPGFYPAPGNAWFAEDPMLREIGRIGEHLTTAGPLLIKLQYRGDYPVYVEGQRFQARVQPRLRKLDFIDRTAVEAGAFVGSDFDVLVVHNDDPWRTQEARVTIKKSSREHVKHVYDLLTLKPIDVSDAEDRIAFDVSFAPGDGRLYLIGDDQAFRKASRTVLRNRCKHQLMLIERNLDITRRGGVGVSRIEARINQALAMADAKDFARALAELETARNDLLKAEEGEPVYAAIRGDIEQIRCDFIDTHNWLVDHGDLFQPGAGGDPALRGLCERVIKLTMQFGALENAFRTGELRPAEAASLRKIVREIKTKVLSYRPPKLIDRSIAVVQMGKPTPDDDSLYDWLRMTYTQVDRVWPDGKADFVDGDGGPISLSDYEMLWVHLSGLSSAVQSRYCVTADVDLNSLPPEAVSAVKRFVDQGGGLVLSGMAACLVKPLGLDSTMPNEVYWGTMYVPGDAPMKWERWNNCGKVLGLKPMVAGHPVFKTLPAQGFGVWDYDESELLSKAVWCRRPPKRNSIGPAWPKGGTVLAGYYSDGAEIPDDFAVIVEYTGNEGGKIVVVGDGIDPDPGRRIDPRFSAKIQNSNRDKLIRNIVDYCSGG
jgi:hypothetical protein